MYYRGMSSRIAFALDVPNLGVAQELVNRLSPHVGAFKVGLELFIAAGDLPKTDVPIILDLKLHDIPETVERAVKAGGDRGVKYMTLHVQQAQTIEKAVKAAGPYGILLLGVTVLTSMTDQDCDDLRYTTGVLQRAPYLVRMGYDYGLRGFVCSPQEVGHLRALFPSVFFLVPGVRPAGADLGDQKRVGTPKQAVQDGANLIVVGRPIRDAADPVAAAIAINQEVDS